MRAANGADIGVVSDAAGVIVAAGTGEGAFEHCCRTVGLDPADRNAVIDAEAYSDPRLRGHPRARRMGEELR